MAIQRFVTGRLILSFLLNLRLKESRNQCQQFSWIIKLEITQLSLKISCESDFFNDKESLNKFLSRYLGSSKGFQMVSWGKERSTFYLIMEGIGSKYSFKPI